MFGLIRDIKEFLEWREKKLTKKIPVGNHSTTAVFSSGGRMIINGSVVPGDFSGRNVSIVNGVIKVDGKEIGAPEKTVNVEIHGNIELLQCEGCHSIKIDGDVGTIDGGSSSINCSLVKGDVSAGSGTISCSVIAGNVTAGSGSIKSETIKGNVKTGSGKIKYGRS